MNSSSILSFFISPSLSNTFKILIVSIKIISSESFKKIFKISSNAVYLPVFIAIPKKLYRLSNLTKISLLLRAEVTYKFIKSIVILLPKKSQR